MSKQHFKEVKFKRLVTRDPSDDQKITVSFERIRVVKENVCLTVAQAATLNAGKTTYAGNIEFTLLLKEGEADPAPQVLALEKVDRLFDSKNNLIDRSPGWIDRYGRQDGRRNSY